jgi:hypothetical protein
LDHASFSVVLPRQLNALLQQKTVGLLQYSLRREACA